MSSDAEGFSESRMYALSLLDYAVNNDLSGIFQQIWAIVLSGRIVAENAETGELRTLLEQVPPDDLEETLLLFINMARNKMNTHKAEVITAAPISREQLHRLEIKLIGLLRKQLDITATVDPSLLGGLRVVVDDMVIDHSVKRRLFEMKQAVYRGVYLNDGTES